MGIGFFTGDGVAKHTQNAATRIQVPLGGGPGFTHVNNMRYTDTGTAHTLTLMRGASRSKAAGSVAAAGTLLTTNDKLVDGAGNDIAASDVVAAQLDDGSWHVSTVASLDTPKTGVTLTTAVPTGRTIPDAAKVVCYGVAGDAMHAHQQYVGGASSAAVNYPAASAGDVLSLCKGKSSNEPIIFDSDNATNAGTLNYANTGQTLQ